MNPGLLPRLRQGTVRSGQILVRAFQLAADSGQFRRQGIQSVQRLLRDGLCQFRFRCRLLGIRDPFVMVNAAQGIGL